MCLLTYFPEHVQPVESALTCGAKNNRDGHGFAIVIPKTRKIIVRKSMQPKKLIQHFLELREEFPNGPAIFHSRITTAGTTDKRNVHPFPVRRDKRILLAHNGIFPQAAQPGKDDRRSDTRIVADEIAPRFQLHTQEGRERFEDWMGGHSKVALLTTHPAFDRFGYILNEDLGTWDSATGIWYSNGSWRPSIQKAWYETESAPWDDCAFCKREFAVSPYSLYCWKCDRCSMCGAWRDNTRGWGAESAACDCSAWARHWTDYRGTVVGYPSGTATGTVARAAITAGAEDTRTPVSRDAISVVHENGTGARKSHIAATIGTHRFECGVRHATPAAVADCVAGFEMWLAYVEEELAGDAYETTASTDEVETPGGTLTLEQLQEVVNLLNNGAPLDEVS